MDTYSALLEARGRFVKLCITKLTLDLYKTNYSIYVLNLKFSCCWNEFFC